MTTLIGIDPGLVNTGLVLLHIDEANRQLEVEYHVFDGEENHARDAKHLLGILGVTTEHTFIEAYRERGTSYGTNTKMRDLLADFRSHFRRARVIDNTGSKQVVKAGVLRVLGLHKFPTTHHQDLQAAARILVFGALKDPELNALLYRIVADHLDDNPWPVIRP